MNRRQLFGAVVGAAVGGSQVRGREGLDVHVEFIQTGETCLHATAAKLHAKARELEEAAEAMGRKA